MRNLLASTVFFVTILSATGASSQEPIGAWTYKETSDQMRGTVQHFATLRSDNALDFAFPYQGGSRGTLTLRLEGSTLNVLLSVDKGQFMCSASEENIVSAKFDAGPVQDFRCNTSSDGNTGVIFVMSEMDFLRQLKASSKLIMEAEFYREGRRQLVFTVPGLTWSLAN